MQSQQSPNLAFIIPNIWSSSNRKIAYRRIARKIVRIEKIPGKRVSRPIFLEPVIRVSRRKNEISCTKMKSKRPQKMPSNSTGDRRARFSGGIEEQFSCPFPACLARYAYIRIYALRKSQQTPAITGFAWMMHASRNKSDSLIFGMEETLETLTPLAEFAFGDRPTVPGVFYIIYTIFDGNPTRRKGSFHSRAFFVILETKRNTFCSGRRARQRLHGRTHTGSPCQCTYAPVKCQRGEQFVE